MKDRIVGFKEYIIDNDYTFKWEKLVEHKFLFFKWSAWELHALTDNFAQALIWAKQVNVKIRYESLP